MGLSGSISVYGDSLDRLLNPSLVIHHQSEKLRTLDEVMSVIRAVHPKRVGAWLIEYPLEEDEPFTAWYGEPSESIGKLYAPLMVSIDPYSGKVLANRWWGDTARTWFLDLHNQLLLGRFGWVLVGFLGIGLFFSLISGLVIWWPGFLRLASRIKLNCHGGMDRFFYDLHLLLGFFVLVPLGVVTFTGINLSFPGGAESLVGSKGVIHGHNNDVIVQSSGMPESARPVSVDEAVLLARGPFPKAQVRYVITPDGPKGAYCVAFHQDFETDKRHPLTSVWVDQYSGQIREVRNPVHFSWLQKFVTSFWSLHSGQGLGPLARFIWFLSGICLSILYITGFVRWLIGQGVIKDFDIDWSPAKRVCLVIKMGVKNLWMRFLCSTS